MQNSNKQKYTLYLYYIYDELNLDESTGKTRADHWCQVHPKL